MKKKMNKNANFIQKDPKNTFYVWVDYSGDYFRNRDKLEEACGESGGSGCGFGGCDCSWHNLSEKEAKRIASRAKRFKFVKSVSIKKEID